MDPERPHPPAAENQETLVVSHRTVRKVALASTCGTALEWFDYFIYGTAAALVFNTLFFPTLDPIVGTLTAFLAFGSGFLARPLGSIFFGHLGDRIGRKPTLITTIIGMGVATGLIGVLPTYETIGVAAPILLTVFRLAQGFSVGGEWGGATSITLEYAPPKYRARYNMLVQLGAPMGSLLSTGAFALLASLPQQAFMSWGWRIPFLAAFVMVLIGLYMRLQIEESPAFRNAVTEKRIARVPLLAALRTAWGRLIAGILAAQLSTGAFYIVTTFMVNYGTESLDLSRSLVLNAILIGTAVQMLVVCAYGWSADRVGVFRVFSIGAALAIVVPFPVFALVDTQNAALVTLGIVVGIAIVASPFGVIGVMLGVVFSDELRYTGLSVSYNAGGIVGGFTPALSLGLLSLTGGSWGVALLLMGIGAVSVLGCLLAWVLMRREEGAIRRAFPAEAGVS